MENIGEINSNVPVLNSDNKSTIREPLWKLFRGKFLITFTLCADCRDRIFKKSDKAVRNENRIEVKFDMCEDCFKKNCRVSDIITPYTPKSN